MKYFDHVSTLLNLSPQNITVGPHRLYSINATTIFPRVRTNVCCNTGPLPGPSTWCTRYMVFLTYLDDCGLYSPRLLCDLLQTLDTRHLLLGTQYSYFHSIHLKYLEDWGRYSPRLLWDLLELGSANPRYSAKLLWGRWCRGRLL